LLAHVNRTVNGVGARRNSRQLILEAAGREFGRHGFAGARVDRIARSAGVNKQLIFYYFRSKAGLFEAILRSLADTILTATTRAATEEAPIDQLRATIGRIWETFAAHADLLRVALLAGQHDGAAVNALREALGPVADRIRSLVSQGQGLGYVRDDLEPEAVAVQVLATALGYVSLDGVLAERRSPDQRMSIDLLLRPLAW
jgi:AcrR family transcriptional regulator